MDRRMFLQAVAGLGLASLLPNVSADALSDADVDCAWQTLERAPVEFQVVNGCTLMIAGYPEPETRLDVFCLDESCADSPAALALELDYCYPLAWHVGRMADEMKEEALVQLDDALSDDDLTPAERSQRLDAAAAAWPDPDDTDALQRWLGGLDAETFTVVAAAVREWLNDAPDWRWESDYFSDYANGQSAALAFFRRQPFDVLDRLGVVIVEGEHPGSTYYAAELSISPDDANSNAKRADIPVRFVEG